MLFDRERIVGAALDGGVVAHNHAVNAADAADAGNQAGAGRAVAAVAVGIHAQGGQRREFQKRCSRIKQHPHPLARQQFAARLVFGARHLATAQGNPGQLHMKIVHQRAHGGGIGLKIGGTGVEFCL